MPSEQAKRTVDRGSKNSGYNPSIARCAVVGRFQPRRRPPRRASKASLTNNCTAEQSVEEKKSYTRSTTSGSVPWFFVAPIQQRGVYRVNESNISIGAEPLFFVLNL